MTVAFFLENWVSFFALFLIKIPAKETEVFYVKSCSYYFLKEIKLKSNCSLNRLGEN